MPSSTEKFAVWDDFSFGEYGELGGFHAPPKSFTGANVIRYTDGSLGPRPGLIKYTVTGNVTGRVWGIFPIEGGVNGALMIVIGAGVYEASTDSIGTLTSVGALAAAPSDFVHADWYNPNGEIYLASAGDGLYVVDWTAHTVTALNVAGGTKGVRAVALVRDRLFVGGDTVANFQRVYYSDAAAFTTIGVPNFFDVGYWWDVYVFLQMQNSTLIGTRSAGWWALVGSNPASGTLRQINAYLSPGKQHEVVRAPGGEAFFWYAFPGGGTPNPTLVTTNGAVFDEERFRHLRLPGYERFGVYLKRYKNVFYCASDGFNNGLLLNNNAWSKLEFSVALSGPVSDTNNGDAAILVGGDSDVTAGNYYGLAMGLDRPGYASDTVAQPGDNSTTALNAFFYLPEFHHPEGRDMRVRRIIVDLKKWRTGAAGGNNGFNCVLRTFSRYNNHDFGTSTIAWSEAETSAATSGTRDRIVFRLGDQGWGGGFQVGITGMVGVNVYRVIVEYDESGDPPTNRSQSGRPL